MKYLSPSQVAMMTGLNRQEVYRAIHRGELPAYQRNGYKGRKGRIRIRREDAHEFFEAAFVYIGTETEGDTDGGRHGGQGEPDTGLI